MLIIPAIDLQGGQAVRLLKGDYNQKTVYSHDPVQVAKDFEAMGAKYLHVVDLDGAKAGSTVNLETIRQIRAAINIPMQLGGGVRTAEIVSMYLDDVGIDRVILGTIAVSNPEFVWEMVQTHGPEKIVVGVDVRFLPDTTWAMPEASTKPMAGFVATGGWTEDSTVNYLGFIDDLKAMGVRYLVVTDISRDGTLTSPNWDMYEKIQGINIVVSGGVASEAHIEKAAKYYGIIVGKAHYEGKVDLRTCLMNQ
ncbi:MAG: 1-(5-phosphoribosyl)-5-[(5-phosphoribosylamino)methylideneamino]imidazole-4-carboxamide isomerase [Defluviitaleaceae bacterium]|nr:1-(5-phosphoribosyl)-5-[(5-phosphoribosylamino)methylideneamino]imidazole-4-carboxamide isomerase [Defluviitaleaceae bacterium]